MATITLDIFSGLPNPSVNIPDERLGALFESVAAMDQGVPRGIGLGFRGLEIARELPQNARFAEFRGADYEGAEASLYIPADFVPVEFLRVLTESGEDKFRGLGWTAVAAMLRSPNLRFSSVGAPLPAAPPACATAPPYDPANWNNDPFVRANNNCYNFACARPTNTFAQPGRATGHMAPFPPTCGGVTAGATSDGLVSVASGACQAQGHVVAVVVSPSIQDYHWYRMGTDGMWSHKPGQTAATNLDNSGRPIADPMFADRGPYTQFCGYMRVGPGAININ